MKKFFFTALLAFCTLASSSFAAMPDSRLGLSYATAVDSGFFEKDFSSGGLGIAPDVIIPLPFARKLTDNIDDWVLWVAEDLKK